MTKAKGAPPVAVESPYVAQLIEWLAKMTRRKWEQEGKT
jgi:hypothetical protein